MSVVTPAEIAELVPGLQLSDTSTPTLEQVQEAIDTTQSEVEAELAGVGVDWPVDETTAAAKYLKSVVQEGALWRTYRIAYADTTAQGEPSGLNRAGQAYQQLKGRIPNIARGMQQTDPATAGRNMPLLGSPKDAIRVNAETFDELERKADRRADWRARRRYGYPYGYPSDALPWEPF